MGLLDAIALFRVPGQAPDLTLTDPEMDFIDEDAIDDTHPKHIRARKFELFGIAKYFEGDDAITRTGGGNLRFEKTIQGGFGLFNVALERKDGNITFTETNFSYGYGAGFRWDLNDKVFIKGVYHINITRLKLYDKDFRFRSFKIYLGVKF